MNYRHQFHAGNFADVVKHVLLRALVRGLQRKERGFLYLETHAGRGRYDLAAAERGDSLARRPEWPDGIARLDTLNDDAPALVRDYVDAVRRAALIAPVAAGGRLYPGSPVLVAPMLRPQDRMVLCELQEEEHRVLTELPLGRRVRVERTDGYAALRAHLPPLERRALVLIDPPFEAGDEHARVREALRTGLERLPGGTFAIWYPLTERSRSHGLIEALAQSRLPPAWAAELTIAGSDSPLRMKGCGVMVINPPWQLDREVDPVLRWLAPVLAQAPGGGGGLRWIVPE